MAYATPAELIECYDADLVGDLAQDNRYSGPQSSVIELPNVAKMLEQASGEIDVALLAGGKYRPDQLAALTGVSKAHLVRMTCAIAMALLYRRRPSPAMFEVAKQFSDDMDRYLKYLRTGANIFDIAENKDASVIDHQTVSAVDIDQLNLLPSRMGNYFPSNSQRVSRAN